MLNQSLCVVAKITPNIESFELVKTAILSIVKQTQDEAGCLQFKLHQSLDASTLYLYEQWENQSALDLHFGKPYTQAVISNFGDWISTPIEIEKMVNC